MATKARIDLVGTDKTKRAFRSAEGSLKRFRTAALGVGAILTTGLFTRATKGAIDFADSLDKAAKVAGVSAEFLQEMQFAGDQLGITTRQVEEGFRRFTRRLGEFANSGAGPAAKAIEQLGIEVTDAEGKFRGSEVIFRDFAARLEEFDTFAKKSAVAAQIFGDDAGPKLALLLDQGVRGIDRLSQEARDIGAVMSNEVIANAVEAKDALAKLSSVLKVQLSTALVDLAPLLTSAAQGFVELAKVARLAFSDLNNLSADLLIRKLDNLEELRADTIDRLTSAKEAAGDNSFLGTVNNLFSRDVETFQTKVDELDVAIMEAELALGSLNLKAAFEEGIAGGSLIPPEGLIDAAALKKDVDAILKRLNPLKSAAIKFNEEVAKIEKSDLGTNEKIAALQKLEQEFAAATGGAKEFADSTKEFELLQDRLFPLQKAAKDFNAELALIKRNTIAGPEQEEAIRRLEKGFSDATGANKELQKENKKLGDGAVDMGFAFSSAFEDAILGGEKFSDVLDGLLEDLAKIALRVAVTAPLGTAVGTGIATTFPGFASGTNFAPGGLAVVGERGPELVDLPRGSRVHPNGAGGTTVNIVNNTGERTDVRRSNDGSGRELINVIIGQVAQSISSGGPVAQAMQGAFGVRRQGIVRT